MKKILPFLIAVLSILFPSCSKDNLSDRKEKEKVIELDVPRGLRLASWGDESIKMEWEPVKDAEFYAYRVIAKVVHEGVAVDSIVAHGETYNTYKTIEALDPECEPNGYNYWFSVAACAGTLSESGYSSYVRCEPGGLTPLIPGNIRQTAYSDYGFTFEWDAAESADYYSYKVMNAKGQIIQTGDVQGTKKVFDGLKKGRYYYVSVKGANAAKESKFSEGVEGLTYGTYIPAVTFNASFGDPSFTFVEGTELIVTDTKGNRAGYIVKSSGKTSVLELTTEEEVEPGQSYTAFIPESLCDGAIVGTEFFRAADGTFSGVPAWAVSKEAGNTDLVFQSYYSLVKLNVSSVKGVDVSEIKLYADRPVSGSVSGVAPDSPLNFSRVSGCDGGITVRFDAPVRISSSPQALVIPVPVGNYNSLSTMFFNEGNPVAGHAFKQTSVIKGTVLEEKVDMMIVTEVSALSYSNLAMSAYAVIGTGTTADYDFGFVHIPYGSSDWTSAEFVPGRITNDTGGRAVFEASVADVANCHVRACAKPKGAPSTIASTGQQHFAVFMDFRTSCPLKPSTEDEAYPETRYGITFPTANEKFNVDEKYPETTFILDGLPLVFTSSTKSGTGTVKYRFKWDGNALLSNKMRVRIYGQYLPGYRPSYLYWSASEKQQYFIGTQFSFKSAVASNASKSNVLEASLSTIEPGSNVIVGSDSNNEGTSYIVLWYSMD